jgi:hypothetical protein
MRQLALDLKTNYKNLTVLTVKSTLNSVRIEKARRTAAYLENKNEEFRRLMRESETTMTQIKEAYSNVKGQAKAALQKAKSLSKNCTPEDEAFDEFRQAYESLSADFRQLQEEKQQLVAKIDCLNTADDDEMREYEERVEVQNRKWFLLQFVFNIFVVDQRYAREHRPGPPRGEQDIVEDGRAARGVVGSAPRARLADQRELHEGFREDGLRRRGLGQPGRR